MTQQIGSHDLSFCPVLQEMVKTGHWQSEEGKAYPLLGASTRNNLAVLRALALEMRPKRTIEIGFAMAVSALVFLQSHKDLGHAPERQHVVIDPWQIGELQSLGLRIVRQAGLEEFLDFRDQTSDLALPSLLESNVKFDLAYIDGSHWFEDVFLDCHYTYHLLDSGGVVLFDDCRDPNIAKVIRFIRRNMGYGLTEIDLAPYRPDQGRSLRFRVARLLNQTQMVGFRKTGDGRRPHTLKTRSF